MKKIIFQKRWWFILLVLIWILNKIVLCTTWISFIVRITFQLLIVIGGIFLLIIPFFYCLLYFRDLDNKVNFGKALMNIGVIICLYVSYYFLLFPYPGDYVLLIRALFYIRSVRIVFLTFILILPVFFRKTSKEKSLSRKEYIFSFIFALILQFLLVYSLAILETLILNLYEFKTHGTKDEYMYALKNSLLVNNKYIMLFLAISVTVTYACCVLFIIKDHKKVFFDKKITSAIYKILFNSLFVIMANQMINKDWFVLILEYFILLTLVYFTRNSFKKWFAEYNKEMLVNIMQVIVIGAVYTFSQYNNMSTYINNDFLQMIMSVLIFYAVQFSIVELIKPEDKDHC